VERSGPPGCYDFVMSPLDHEPDRASGDDFGPGGGEWPPSSETAPGRPWLGVVEALSLLLACLATALAVGGMELILLAPPAYELEFRLYERAPPEALTDPDRLVERIETLDLPGSVERTERRGRASIIVRGLESVEPTKARIEEVLTEGGYRRIDPEVRSGPDPRVLLRDYPALTLGSQAIVLILFGAVLARARVRHVAPKASAGVALGSGILAGLGGFLAALLLSAIQHLLGWSIEEQSWILELLRDRTTLLTVLPLVVLLMPFSEETLFRGYVFRFLLERSGPRTAYLVSAASFSAVHLHLPGVPTYFVVGLLFAYVCRRTGTLYAPMVGHATYNALAVGLSLLGPGGP